MHQNHRGQLNHSILGKMYLDLLTFVKQVISYFYLIQFWLLLILILEN